MVAPHITHRPQLSGDGTDLTNRPLPHDDGFLLVHLRTLLYFCWVLMVLISPTYFYRVVMVLTSLIYFCLGGDSTYSHDPSTSSGW
jgi:hypothetical protein